MITRRTDTPVAQPIDRVRVRINGRAMIASATGATVVFAHDAELRRCSITSRDIDQAISLTVEDDDEQRTWDAQQRVREAAARPPAPRSDRPSARVRAARTAAREYHAATWNHGYAEGQARYAALPLAERVRPSDLPELTELLMRSVLGNAELRDELRAALDGAEIEQALAAELTGVPAWVAERTAS